MLYHPWCRKKVIISRNEICLNDGKSKMQTNVDELGDSNKYKKATLYLNDEYEIKPFEGDEDLEEKEDK